MGANPYSRGTSPGRARTAIAAAAKRLARGAPRDRYHWQRVMNNNPLISEAVDHQGQFTLAGAPARACTGGAGSSSAWPSFPAV
jgi:hypothetical protein